MSSITLLPTDPRARGVSRSDEDYVADALAEVIEGRTVDRLKWVRIVMKVCALAITVLIQIPYRSISRSLWCSEACVVGNVTAFAILDFYVISEVIDAFLQPRGEMEAKLFAEMKGPLWKRIAIVVVAFALSILGQLPTALPALKYNTYNTLFWFIVGLIGGAFFSTNSVARSLDFSCQRRDEMGKKLSTIQTTYAQMIRDYREQFEGMDLQAQKDFIVTVFGKRGGSQAGEAVNVFLSTMIEPALDKVDRCSPRKCVHLTAKGVAWGLTLSFLVGMSLYTYDDVHESKKYRSYALATATGVFLTNALITRDYLVSTTTKIASTVYNFFTCKQKPTLAERLHVKATLCLRIIGLIIDLLAMGAVKKIWDDYDNRFFAATVPLAVFLFLLKTTFSFVDDLLEDLTLISGTEAEKEVIRVGNQLGKLAQILENSSINRFGIFLFYGNERIRDRLLAEVNLRANLLAPGLV